MTHNGRGSGYPSIPTLKGKGDEHGSPRQLWRAHAGVQGSVVAASRRRFLAAKTPVCRHWPLVPYVYSPSSPCRNYFGIQLELACLAVQGLEQRPCALAPSWLSLSNCCWCGISARLEDFARQEMGKMGVSCRCLVDRRI